MNYKNVLIIIVLLSIFAACSQPKRRETSSAYTIDSLFKHYDSNTFEIVRIENREIDVFDKPNIFKEKGIYKFDEKNRLYFYAFIIDSTNGYDFSITYDSLGNIINKTGHEVVEWYSHKVGKDSLSVTFYFYAIKNSYLNVSFIKENDSIRNIILYKHPTASNLIGRTVKILFPQDTIKREIYVSGLKVNNCTHDTVVFKDSTRIPAKL